MAYNWNQPTHICQPTLPNTQIIQPQSYSPTPTVVQNTPPQPTASPRPQIYYIPGRPVNSPDEVQAYEVPMDSPMSIFPKADRNEIYVKYWGEKGTIETDVYVKVNRQNDQNASSGSSVPIPDSLADVQKQLNRIEKMLKYGNRSKYNHKPQRNGGDSK